ncbi:MAG: DUF4465 domain-containing protein [Rikenellaceae bacterium]|nr:DUF4465 domain-containing protein [Rikenellaceae bacterium]
MRKIVLLLAVVAFVACDNDWVNDVKPRVYIESFEAEFEAGNSGDFEYGYETDEFKFEHFYNEEFGYWGGFVQTKKFDTDAANGLYENQYAVYSASASHGTGALLYYYDSYNEPCDIVIKGDHILTSVRLNLTTYTYASITNEDINTFARAFTDGDYLKVVFTSLKGDKEVGKVECYVVDYRDGKQLMATRWDIFDLTPLGKDYERVRVKIETTDVGEYGANTPLYIALDELSFL